MLKRLPAELLNKLRNANLTENITVAELAKVPAEVFRILKVNHCYTTFNLLVMVEINSAIAPHFL